MGGVSDRWRPPAAQPSAWPVLPVDDWADTVETLHLLTQVVGKVRLVCGPWLNHSWGVPLYVSARGLRTGLVPYGATAFELELDLTAGPLLVVTTAGHSRELPIAGTSVAGFYAGALHAMARLGLPVSIHPVPSEIADAQPFDTDTRPRAYDPEHARLVWMALVQAQRVFTDFRAGFVGKVSPVHSFWGSFDLAVTRFSGRPAPPHPGGVPHFPDDVAREAYSHEVTSVGFWLGSREAPKSMFYAYAYPTPAGFAEAAVQSSGAAWLGDLGEFALPYESIRTAPDPDAELLVFAESTHAAAADLAGWDRAALELDDPHPPSWWHRRREHR